MAEIFDLRVCKGKPVQEQRELVDELTERFRKDPSIAKTLLLDIKSDGVVDVTEDDDGQIIRYCLLAIMAADIATVPYAPVRSAYVDQLESLTILYGISKNKVVYLSSYAEEFARYLETVEGND